MNKWRKDDTRLERWGRATSTCDLIHSESQTSETSATEHDKQNVERGLLLQASSSWDTRSGALNTTHPQKWYSVRTGSLAETGHKHRLWCPAEGKWLTGSSIDYPNLSVLTPLSVWFPSPTPHINKLAKAVFTRMFTTVGNGGSKLIWRQSRRHARPEDTLNCIYWSRRVLTPVGVARQVVNPSGPGLDTQLSRSHIMGDN
ncbi:hypothetical protein RRG08_048526 [Elysia crispata]|uniref:Uncharacterized protein n=1 Tax=Elysia crispata TaxID=231223 RepID=A0AAE1E9Z2_9GAST|nr:hypothetical protein RRG08_048526 [Elysia crispata]